MAIDQDDAREMRTAASYRSQLIRGTEGEELTAGPYSLRISNVPMFKASDQGLQQAVRVRVRPSGDAPPLQLQLRSGDDIVAQETSVVTPREQSVFLLVPEVTDPTTFTFEALLDGSSVCQSQFTVMPQRKWTIHLIHHSHYDIGYTDPQSEVLSSQLAYIDAALELCTVTDDWPEDARFRWNIEVNWPLKTWLETRPRAKQDELVRRIHEGRIEVHALPFSMHTEVYSFDELAEQLRVAHELREELGIDIVSAMQTDVPGAAIGLSTLLTDAGVKYFSVAHNYAGRSIPHLLDGQDLTRPFYWEAPDAERLLVWYTDTLNGIAYMEGMTIGFGHGYEDVLGSLPEYLNALSQRPYPYGDAGDWIVGDLRGVNLTKTPYPHDILNLRIQGAFADNASPSLVPPQIAREWNETWAFPRLRMSLNRDFFTEIENGAVSQIETYRGDWTDWWADGVGSAAVPLARNRQSQADIRTAQTLNAIAGEITDDPKPGISESVRDAYEHIALFDEHTWGAANPWEHGSFGMNAGAYQWVRKEGFALDAEERVRVLLEGGIRRIAPLAHSGPSQADQTQLLVFNPASFTRSDVVRVFLPERALDSVPKELIDLETGDIVPFILEAQKNAFYRPRGQFIYFLARDVPPVGYRRYVAVFGTPAEDDGVPAPASQIPVSMSNGLLDINLDPTTATIRSIVDAASNTELVDQNAPYGFNAYIFDHYASAPRFNHLSSRIGTAGPWLLGSRNTGHFGHVIAHESNAVRERISIRYEGDGSDWLETTYTLPRGVARLHIENRLHKPSNLGKESVYYAFPFANRKAHLEYEITGGTTSDTAPHVPGSARHFRAIRNWVSLTAENALSLAWATTDAPLIQTGNIHIPYAPFPTTVREEDASPSTIYSWALNNIWDTNFPPEQGGEMTFRYVIGTGNGDQDRIGPDTTAAATGAFVGVVAPVGDMGGGSDLPHVASFIELGSPRVSVNHITSTNTGGELRIVLESHSAEHEHTLLKLNHLPLNAARSGSYWDTDMTDIPVEDGACTVAIAPGELKSIIVTLG